MAGVSKEIRLRVVGETKAYMDAMAEIPGTTEKQAAQAGRAFSREMVKAERAAIGAATRGVRGFAAEMNRASEAMSATAMRGGDALRTEMESSLKAVGERAGDAESSLKAMGGTLGLVSPEAERLVSIVAELGGGLEGATKGARLLGMSTGGLAASLGLVGAAAAALIVAYTQATRESEQLRERQDLLRQVDESLEPSIRKVEDAQLALAVATGTLTKAQGEAAAATKEAQRSVMDFAGAQAQQRAELMESIETARNWQGVVDGLTFGPLGTLASQATDYVMGWSDSIEHAQGQLDVLDGAVQREARSQKELLLILPEVKAQQDAATGSTKAATAALRAQTTTRAELLRQMGAQAAAEAQLSTLRDDITAAGDEGAQRELAINRELQARVDLLDQIATTTGYTAELEETYQLAQADAQRQRAELRLQDEYDYAAAAAAVEADLDATRAYYDEQESRRIEERRALLMSIAQDSIRQIGALAGEIQSRQMDAMKAIQEDYNDRRDDMSAAEKARAKAEYRERGKAMQRAFIAERATRVIEIGMNTYVAAMRALAVLGPVAGGIAAGVITATGATAAGIVAAQPAPQVLHTGGVVGEATGPGGAASSPDPSERDVRLRVGERVMQPGADGAPQEITILVQLDGEVLDRALIKNRRRGGITASFVVDPARRRQEF